MGTPTSTPALALRTTLRIGASHATPLAAAAATHADVVQVDLAAPAVHGDREGARALLARHAHALTGARRPVHVRVSDARSGHMEADIRAATIEAVQAITVSGIAVPQDARDADVAIRKHEMRLGIVPGTVRLIGEIDSVAGLSALDRILAAVDRYAAVTVDIVAVLADLGVRTGDRGPAAAAVDHVLAQVALAARTAGLPWLLAAPAAPAGDGADAAQRAHLATRAHDLGAAGVVIETEAEARGLNALFTPDAEAIAHARAVLAAWARVRRAHEWVGVLDGALIDRRAAQQARLLIERADTIAARELENRAPA